MDKNGRFFRYRGKLTPDQVAAGMNAARRNAERLRSDAELMLENKRYPSATALAILAIEEAGKTSILRQIAVEDERTAVRRSWRDYRTHTAKNVMAGLPELVAKGARTLEDFRTLMDGSSDIAQVINNLKQVAVYSDCLGNAHWSEPAEVIDESAARMLVTVAGVLTRDSVTTQQEIELWVSHVGPVWRGEMELMKKAVSNWYATCREEGLITDEEGAMDSLLWGGP